MEYVGYSNLSSSPARTELTSEFTQPWMFTSLDQCLAHYDAAPPLDEEIYCNATWDNIMCWPPTPANIRVTLPCPPVQGVDLKQTAYRTCSSEGRWMGKDPFSNATNGWTNYTACFTPNVLDLLNQLYSGTEEEAQIKFLVAKGSRALEIIGLILSLVSLLLSLFIFSYFKFVDFRGPISQPSFRKLRNNRTRIHKNLFAAMILQVLVRLILYADQAIVRGDSTGLGSGLSTERQGIDSTPILCESFYILLEYGRSAMFMWMFIEGMYLNNLISVAFFQGPPNYSAYYFIGWGIPVFMTASWAVVMSLWMNVDCWLGYSLTPYYWILEGPRFTVIGANLLFLLNIMRILISKLREASSSEVQQIRPLRRSVRNALFLLPLLGITNAITMIPKPLERSAFEFGVWSYGTNLLTSFQGFVVACIYCFFNGDVKRTLCYFWRLKVTLRTRKQRSEASSAFPDPDGMYDAGFAHRPKLHFKARSKSSSDKGLPNGHLQSLHSLGGYHSSHMLHREEPGHPYHVTIPTTSL
ncbi:PDF receptor-like [Penaeus chinensis]|uniref:PDF receptor-like n=1 Tax=Penaeus chinensis TaxID=139456 RepID=UPI001FB74E6C|nr:PDF receptor-like [Penaeus chinensis]